MTSPYVYSPSAGYSQLPTAYGTYGRPTSPFIPDTNRYPSSPYGSPYRSNTGSNLPGSEYDAAQGIAFPSSGSGSEGYATWGAPQHHHRERRVSWGGGAPGMGGAPPSPYMGAGVPRPLTPQPYHDSQRPTWGSSGGNTQHTPLYMQPQGWSTYINETPMSPYMYGSSQPPDTFLIHPSINADAPRYDFYFDLASPTFTPMNVIGGHQSVILSTNELQEAATHPPITRLRIISDMLPAWPVDLEFNPQQGYGSVATLQAPPITLGDVLVVLHQRLHERINHVEWASLDRATEAAVAKAYSRRCRRAGHAMEATERANGVKKVDFLMGKTRMVGLQRVVDGWSTSTVTMRLVTTTP